MTLRPRRNLSTKARSKYSERRAQQVFGGRIQPASGAINCVGLKADVKSERFLVDDKTTNKGSYTLNAQKWKELQLQALHIRRSPAMRIEFTELNRVLYVFDEETTMEMLSKI